MKRSEKSWLQGIIWLLILGMPAAWLNAGERLNGTAAGSGATGDLQRMSSEMARLAAQVGPKTVQVVTQSFKVAGTGDEQPAGVLVAGHGTGSGFFVSPDGYLFTNAHVVENAARVKVLVQPADGSAQPGSLIEYPATVVGMDADNDLALLKIDVAGVPFFELNQGAAPRQGQFVLAYGSPMGLSQTATLGLVSAVDRQTSPDDPRTYIQTDASINPGNSGGPLVDLDGTLVGINTMILSQSGGSEGIGLAVPREVIRQAYAALREKGMVSRARLGIQPRSLTADLIAGLDLKVHQGVLVEDVAPYGAGWAAGLLPGDVLVSLNAEPIRNLRDLYRVEYELTAGTSVDLAVMRRENLRLLQITPEAPRDNTPAVSAGNVNDKENLVFRLRLYGATLTPAAAASMGGFREPQGVLVVALAATGQAAQAALAPGDVIHEVNGRPVHGVEGLRAALETIPDGAALVLQIERAGMHSYVAIGAMTGQEHLPRRAGTEQGSAALRGLPRY